MPYNSLNEFIKKLEESGELVRISSFVSPNLEIAEIYDRICKDGGPALLFENNGTDFPLLVNAYGSEKRMCLALGCDNLDDFSADIDVLLKQLASPKNGIVDKLKTIPLLGKIGNWMPKSISSKGVCQEVIINEPDLSILPILKCWPEDGGPFITLPMVHTKDPDSGVRNTGMYRMQMFDANKTGMHWHMHKGSAQHYEKHKKLGAKMPVSVTLGGDPVYAYTATAPLPENIDEHIMAGFLRKKKVELVKCITNDIEVPSDVDFVIEGYVDPKEELRLEGPFGDHTGYYSLADYYPVFHITCITHRRNAVYPATVVGIPPQEDEWLGKATERIFLKPMQLSGMTEIVDINMPAEGAFHNIVIVSIEKKFPGHAQKIMNALWGAGQMMFNKIVIVVDGDVDVHDYKVVAASLLQNLRDVKKDICFLHGPLDVLDHSSNSFAYGSKMGFDATKKHAEEINYSTIKNRENSIELICEKMSIIEAFPDVISVNRFDNIELLVVTLRKSRGGLVKETHEVLVSSGLIAGFGFVIYLDEDNISDDLAYIAWRLSGNIDPMRDSYFSHLNSGDCVVGFDGTRKTKKYDGFTRDWPNIIASDDKTIKAVDGKWASLGLGELLPSPSLRYKSQLYGTGAVAEE